MRNPHDGALHSIEGNRNFRRLVQELVQLFPERGRFPIRTLIPLRRASTLQRAPEPQSTTKCPGSPIDDFRPLLEPTEADVHRRQRLKLVLPRDVGNGYNDAQDFQRAGLHFWRNGRSGFPTVGPRCLELEKTAV